MNKLITALLLFFPFFTYSQFGDALYMASSRIVEQVHFMDTDQDGDIDILAGLGDTNFPKLGWFENVNGEVDFSVLKPIENYTLPTSIAFSGYISSGDLNGDGLEDIIVNNVWLPGLGNGEFGEEVVLDLISFISYQLIIEDIDSDNDLDIIYSNDFGLFWAENDGSGNFSNQDTLISSFTNVNGVVAWVRLLFDVVNWVFDRTFSKIVHSVLV